MSDPRSASMRRVSVVIPAHDEATVIGRCLDRLLSGAEPEELEVVVVCNGCADGTADVARRVAPDATVLEIDIASKSAALNVGDAAATRYPRFYVDADVELDIGALRATTAELERSRVLCAAPRPEFDTTDRPWYIRRFFEVFEQMPFMTGPGVVGTGVYALSRAGRARFGEFPALTADDQFVMDRFSVPERSAVTSARFTVHPPRTLRALLKTRRRTYRGNRELRARHEPAQDPGHDNLGVLLRLLCTRSTAASVPVYVAIVALARLQARKTRPTTWERDDSSR